MDLRPQTYPSSVVAARASTDGFRSVIELTSVPSRIRSVEVGPGGELIIAAWIARLDDPSVIVLPPRPR